VAQRDPAGEIGIDTAKAVVTAWWTGSRRRSDRRILATEVVHASVVK